MTSPTLTWWSLLCAVSVLNLLAWGASVAFLHPRAAAADAATRTALRLQMLLSAGYVFGCAYRSAFPVYDVQRLVLVDSWLSSVLVGRSVATVAELCFALQWALLLRNLAGAHGNAFGLAVARSIVPLIVVAELCSWHAVLSTSNLGHVIEESLWGLSAALLVASFALLRPHCGRELRALLSGTCVVGTAYVVYMFAVDVPMYWSRWVLEGPLGHTALDLSQGLADAAQRWVVSHRWDDWESEVVWMTLYFSVAVWLSLGLVHLSSLAGLRPGATVPRLRRAAHNPAFLSEPSP